ncbi:MAG: hypothetical protein QHH18_07645 [Candidatus Bathyarchaeota archaeon]|jgi:hypothetical protein|nr:hypothetical protein [Candidatus Bathyarchaeota archaeon A05DMB-5]MDH7558453.1 hypothetical protein [Candidatus Bathyarchaeota archaeon]
MSRTKVSCIATIAILVATTMLGFYKIPPSSAFAPTAEANPRLIYWTPTIVWRQGDFINIGHGWINAKSLAWSPTGRYLLIYGRVYESQLYGIPTDEWKC